ncbi:hypothetical protein ACGFSG_26385 [Streptomyces sp. NPDC048512]|uniref:hypothetical protein n=1 Tax=unclassified Streptomyces TaxID=2593676 RepID=UPI0009BE419F|nr:hypothetical protein [Streptomyces sp. M41(2017)]OQQ15513.1 hypothetical protein B0675_26210 [Streptomyces sp. M41(2017)]
MWSSEDQARDTVRRQGRGLTARQVGEKVAEAVVRVRETRQQAATPAGSWGELGGDPAELGRVWEARLVEWRRVAALLESEGHATYEPAQDQRGTRWAGEREQRLREALSRHEGWLAQQRDGQDELRAELWLAADVSRRLRAMAARAGASPEQVLAQLAEHARMNEDGMVTVESFLPR